MTTLILPPIQSAKRRDTQTVSLTAGASASGQDRGLRVPIFMPTSQAYYWTRDWQDGEAEALRDIEDGRVRRFASGAEAARWLLSPDED